MLCWTISEIAVDDQYELAAWTRNIYEAAMPSRTYWGGWCLLRGLLRTYLRIMTVDTNAALIIQYEI